MAPNDSAHSIDLTYLHCRWFLKFLPLAHYLSLSLRTKFLYIRKSSSTLTLRLHFLLLAILSCLQLQEHSTSDFFRLGAPSTSPPQRRWGSGIQSRRPSVDVTRKPAQRGRSGQYTTANCWGGKACSTSNGEGRLQNTTQRPEPVGRQRSQGASSARWLAILATKMRCVHFDTNCV